MSRRTPASVEAGTLIGPYEIVGWLGAGGMGDVYRARDPRLGREVAIKLIRDPFVNDELRLRRFEQEAQAAGQINHPNILAVYDVGFDGGAPYIVSELLEGQSLRSRLQGGALATRKAVDYARQAAEGLAAAHDKGIVHRDLKPDNLFITNDGRVKILDFGIAKLTQPADRVAVSTPASLQTERGMIVGTIDYMSPEQLRGETIDTRSDIFSVGAILYEMLAGRPAFKRGTPAESVAAILKEDPPDADPKTVPSAVARIVSRCLEKTREARFQSARDLAFGLASLPEEAAPAVASPVGTRRTALPRVSRSWAIASVVALASSVIVVRGLPWREGPRPAVLRLTAELGMDASVPFVNIVDGLSLSADGGSIAFVARKPAAPGFGTFRGVEAPPQLYVRRLDHLEATPLAGTDGAFSPFFSPDGRSLGFFAGGTLKKIAVTGGEVITLSEAPNGRGGTWSENNTIVFSPNQTRNTRLLRVSSDGGKTDPLTSVFEDETIQLWPQALPGGRAVLYTGSSVAGNYNDANLVVQSLPSGLRRIVLQGGYHGRYVPSGHLVYMHNGVLLAAPFDISRLALTGSPAAVLESLASNSSTGSAQFAVSANGTLVYLPGETVGPGTPLRWLYRDGKTIPLRVASGNWFNPLFSPDGRRLAMEIREKTSDVWIYQFDRDTLTRFTFDSAGAARPVWTPDGRRIVFSSARDGAANPNLYWQRFPEMGGAERLTVSANAQQPGSWHPTGRFLAFEETNPQTGADLMILPLEGDETSGWKPGKPTVFLRSQFKETEPMFSPDGRWLAYSSNQSGREEVYVRPFPGPGTPTQISEAGTFPVWSRAKQELFYSLNGQIMVARFTVEGASFRPEKPMLWSPGRYSLRGADRMFDLYPDGNRIALASSALTFGGEKEDKAVFIFNILDELRRIAPAK